MSGIFGVISKQNIDSKKYNGLRKWNESYGDLDVLSHSCEHAYIGVKPELMKAGSSTGSTALCKFAAKTGVIDSCIFSDIGSVSSDEEFLFNAINKNGPDSLKDVNGDYAGAIWDEEKKELLLFRDHMGVRPLFYYYDNEKIVFSSDIRGITSCKDVDASVSPQWLYTNLCGFIDKGATDTEYENINCVPFGGYLIFRLGAKEISVETGHYWVPGEKKVRFKSKEEYTKELRRLVEDAVRIRAFATDHKLGGELSGGLDSGVVDILLSKIKKDCFFFSWTPKEEVLPIAEKDERLVIKDICETAGIECNFGELAIDFNKLPLMGERIPIGEGEYGDTSFLIRYAFPCYVNTLPIYETASFMKEKGVKVIFTGHGGDEGASHRSNPYELLHFHEYYRYLRLMYSRSSVSKHRIIKTAGLIKNNLNVVRNHLLKTFLMGSGSSPILKESLTEKFENSRMEPLYFAYDPAKYINRGGSRNRLDVLAFYSACTGVRYFVPLLDYRVVDFALGIPRYLYHNWYYDRFIFREAFKDIIPHSLYMQRDKDDNSYKNLPNEVREKKEHDEAEALQVKKRYADMLDREYWKELIDFDVLDNWVCGNVKEEDEIPILYALLTCIQAEHMVRRSREA